MSVLQIRPRTEKDSKPKQLRRQGILPMALVDRDHNTHAVLASEEELRRAIRHADGHGRIEVQVGEKRPCKAIVKQVDKDYIHGQILHVTLQEVRDSDEVKLDIPVVAMGTPEPVENNQGVLVHPTDHLKVKGQLNKLPERIEVDVSHLQLGESFAASQVELPEGAQLLSSADAILFLVQAVKVEEPAEETTEEAAEGGEAAGEESGGSEEENT